MQVCVPMDYIRTSRVLRCHFIKSEKQCVCVTNVTRIRGDKGDSMSWFWVILVDSFTHWASQIYNHSCLNTGLHRIGELNHPSVPRVVDCLEECLTYSRRICIFRVHSLGVVVLDAQVLWQQSIWLERTFDEIWFHDMCIHLLLSNRTCWGRALTSVSHDKFYVKFLCAFNFPQKRRGLPEFFRGLRAYWGLGGADGFFWIVEFLTFVAGRYGGHGLYAELLCPWYYGLRGTEKGNVVESCGLDVALDKTPVAVDWK